MSDYLQVETTAASVAEAQQIARALVERRLAACVHIAGPIESIYRWQGAIEQSQEWTCTIKTHRDRFEAVAATIREIHAYECPQIIASRIDQLSEDYRNWIDDQVTEL